jgi:transcriptional regulator with XRE-family HTH domain
MNDEFVAWLVDEMDSRGWSQSETARRGKISSGMINMVVNRQSGVGVPFCRGIARAFGISVEEVMRRAGILPQSGELLPEVRDWNERLEYLTAEDRARAIGMMEQVLQFAEDRPQYRARRSRSES